MITVHFLKLCGKVEIRPVQFQFHQDLIDLPNTYGCRVSVIVTCVRTSLPHYGLSDSLHVCYLPNRKICMK